MQKVAHSTSPPGSHGAFSAGTALSPPTLYGVSFSSLRAQDLGTESFPGPRP